MRLLTHNYLQSNVRGTTKGYPLKIEATQVSVEESPMDADMVLRILPKLDYAALVGAWQQVQPLVVAVSATSGNGASVELGELPDALPESLQSPPADDDDDNRAEIDNQLLSTLHRILFDIHVLEGQLICPDTGRKFPIKEGIPNMILHEDEI